MEEENENGGKISLWIWLIPVYILIAIPLVKWTMKISSPDIELSKEEMSAFSGRGEVKKDTYKAHEPNLNDLGFSVNYKGHGASLDEKGSQGVRKPAEGTGREEEKREKRRPSDRSGSGQAGTRNKEGAVDPAKQREMMSVGFKKGFLTDSVGKLLNNPKAVGLLFNNSYVVKGFMGRDTVKNALASPKSLENFLTKSPAVSNFLNNSVVQSALKNQQVLNAVTGSEMGKSFLSAPAVQGLLQDPDMMQKLITSNPQLAGLLSNPNVTSALMSDPEAAAALMQLQSGGAGRK